MIKDGTCDAAVMSILVGAGRRRIELLAVYEWDHFYGSSYVGCPTKASKRQKLVVSSSNEIGRIARSGQKDGHRFTVKAKGRIDAASMARCERNLTEAQAILMIEQKEEVQVMLDGTTRRCLLIE